MPQPSRPQAIAAVVAILLVALVGAIYWPVGGHAFIALDDGRYVAANPMVRAGLTRAGMVWALSELHEPYWQPLARLAHLIDVELFGLDAGAHHRVSVAWHATNAALLFLVLWRATRSLGASALAAALFAAHPLQVETVAWVAERKELMSTAFGLATIAAWLHHLDRPSPRRYLVAATAFVLALLSKPMVVTLPLLLLVLDVWPLGRLDAGAAPWPALRPRIREKLPLFALAAAAALVAMTGPRTGGPFAAEESLAWPVRLANAVVATAWYLGKLVWPSALAVLYPHPGTAPGGISAERVAGAAAVLIAISALVLRERRRRPHLIAGWLWYLLALLPVSGLVQVGPQGMANRFTYLPAIGLFVAVAWLARELALRSTSARNAVAVVATSAAVALALAARAETAWWRDSFTLFRRAVAVTEHNWVAWKNLGVEQFQAGQHRAACASFARAVEIRPADPDGWLDLGMAHAMLDQHAAAAAAFERVVALSPDDAEAWFNLGIAAALLGQRERAAEAKSRLARLAPARARELEERVRALVD